jgi:2-oxoglutarate ferredoxin oxidoreductase subunit gamma
MKIKFIGEAGQGIKTISLLLGEILTEKNKKVSVSLNYGTNVRSGRITSDIIFSKNKKIENPKIFKPDILIILSNGNLRSHMRFRNSKIITPKEIDFEKMSFKNFNRKKFASMIALGKILKLLNIDFTKVNIKNKLPKKFKQKNIKAIKIGYDLE